MISTRAPGKLYIAGEYAVVQPGQPAVLVAVDRYITVQLVASEHPAQYGRVHSNAYDTGPLVWARDGDTGRIVVEHEPRDYVISAIRTVDRLRAERSLAPAYFDVHITSELEHAGGRKYGLGSSAAVTVALIEALDTFYQLGLTRTERFKLALLATIDVSPRASGGDLAASTYGGWIRYTSPDRAALLDHLAAGGVSDALEGPGWDSFSVRPLPAPEGLDLLVGWTGSPASTEILVAGVQPSGVPYHSFLADSRACVDDLVRGLGAAGATDAELVSAALWRARRVLQRLGESAGMLLETESLRALCDIAENYGAAGKPSGAGGGDCGIVLTPTAGSATDILAEWAGHDITQLNLVVHTAEGGAHEC